VTRRRCDADHLRTGDIERRCLQFFEAVRLSPADVGVSLSDLVSLTNYVTIISQRAAANAVRYSVLGDTGPASTLVDVSALGAPGAVIEIDAIAVELAGAGGARLAPNTVELSLEIRSVSELSVDGLARRRRPHLGARECH
jgi:hypothetical protein